MKFNELVFEHIRFDEHTRTNVNRLFDEWWWSYFKVFDVSRNSDEDADIDISSLFNG